jgi:hypothetical protein
MKRKRKVWYDVFIDNWDYWWSDKDKKWLPIDSFDGPCSTHKKCNTKKQVRRVCRQADLVVDKNRKILYNKIFYKNGIRYRMEYEYVRDN